LKQLEIYSPQNLLKGNTSFTDKLKELVLPNTTKISGAISYCVDNNKLEFGELLKLLSDRGYSPVKHYSLFEYVLKAEKLEIANKMLEFGFDINSHGAYKFYPSNNEFCPHFSYYICDSLV
jgi:hypothetical protein